MPGSPEIRSSDSASVVYFGATTRNSTGSSSRDTARGRAIHVSPSLTLSTRMPSRAISSAVSSRATTVTGMPARSNAPATKPPTPPGPSIAHAFTGTGLTFGIAYLAIVLVHAGLFARSTEASVVQAVVGLARFNVSSAALLVVGGALGGTAEYILWTAAFLLEWITPPLTGISDFSIQAAHFVERHGLVVIVAIGESVVAIGIGAAGLPVNAELVLVAVLGLMLSACLWWADFAGGETRAGEALPAAPPRRAPPAAGGRCGAP